jgi:hypothetical protein
MFTEKERREQEKRDRGFVEAMMEYKWRRTADDWDRSINEDAGMAIAMYVE